MNIPLATVTAGEMLIRMPRRGLHLRKEKERVLGGIADKDAVTLASRVGGRRRRWWRVSKSHPKIILRWTRLRPPVTVSYVRLAPS